MTREERDRLRAGTDQGIAFAAAVADELERQNDVDGGLAEELAALRQAVVELAGRVSSLERALGPDEALGSRSVASALVSEPYYVVNAEADPREVIGSYMRTVEDVVEYRDGDGMVRRAPEDCVIIVGPNRLASVLTGGAVE